jgi:hypothetical protein
VLTVDGAPPGGLTSAAGVPLDGSGEGRPGTDFVARFGRDALAGPAALAFKEFRHR